MSAVVWISSIATGRRREMSTLEAMRTDPERPNETIGSSRGLRGPRDGKGCGGLPGRAGHREVRLREDPDRLRDLPDGSEARTDDDPDALLLGDVEEALAHDPVEDDRLRRVREGRDRLDHLLHRDLADDRVVLADDEAARR